MAVDRKRDEEWEWWMNVQRSLPAIAVFRRMIWVFGRMCWMLRQTYGYANDAEVHDDRRFWRWMRSAAGQIRRR